MREGEVVEGRYRICRHAGAGGMGSVYEAIDMRDGAVVALKTWHAAPSTEPLARARLWREARALAELRHPAIVRYVDHGSSSIHGPFLAMAWIAGETLANRLITRGIRPVDALALALRLASGLSAMHAAGVVHRDIKPSNIMLPDGDVERAIIVDFGVASVSRYAEASGEAPAFHLGTARYMAPEQIRNARTVDGRADVFALGCVLFEALTGRAAFEGSDPVSVLARILFEPLPVPSAVRPALPGSIDSFVLSLLDRELERRPTAAALGELLESLRRSPDARTIWAALGGPHFGGLAELGSAPLADPRKEAELERTSPAVSSRQSPAAISRRLAFPLLPTLPALTTSFVGRDDEVDHLAALLRAGTPVVSVWGGPGIGKTRLVLEAVRRLASAPSPPWDALVFGDLEGARDADDIARILARSAGVALESSSSPEIALGHALGKLGRVLVVVDPIDPILTPLTAALMAWRHVAPGLTVLAASRTRWRPPGVVAIEVGPLACTAQGQKASPAASLFLDRARDRAGDRLDAIEQLVTALDGVPLAIELYAARADALGPGALLARAPGRSDSDATLDASEGTMTRTIAWSWHLLSPLEQRAFAQCAVFRGGFTEKAAAEVVRAGEGTTSLELLRSLRDKSLLASFTEDAEGEPRLAMLASVREFAWGMLKSGSEIGDALGRHASYYANAFAPGPHGVPVHAVARVEREAENLFAAAEFALEGDGEDSATGLMALMALEPAMLARGAMGSYRELLDRALRVPVDGSAPRIEWLNARVRQIRARLDAPRGRTDRALTDLTTCLRVAEGHDDAHWRGQILLDRGVAHHRRRELALAQSSYEAALVLLVNANDARAEGRCMANLGALDHDQGEFARAAARYRRAIALFEAAGDTRQCAHCMANLAVLTHELGDRDNAERVYQSTLELLEPTGDARRIAITLGNFGVLQLELGRFERALALSRRSLALIEGTGDPLSEALAWGRLGAALTLLHQTDEAGASIEQGEQLALGAHALVVEAVRLQRALLDLVAKGDTGSARGAIARVKEARLGERSLAEQSDDIRSTLRILEAELARREK